MEPSQSSSDPSQQEQFEWKGWKLTHPELKRSEYSTVVMDDKIVVLNGVKPLVNEENYTVEQALNIVIVDPKAQTVQVLPPIGDDAKQLCWCSASACYWKDSKIVVFGGQSLFDPRVRDTVGIITLKDLDSENPSAHWEQVHSTTSPQRCDHLAHIYQDKMYTIGGSLADIWCLDLVTFEWIKCEFAGSIASEKKSSLLLNLIHPIDKPFLQYAFSENKLYAVHAYQDLHCFAFFEYDINTFTCKYLTGPGLPRTQNLLVFRQVHDGKIYALSYLQPNPAVGLKATPIKENELWTYGIDSQEWTEIKVPNGYPSFTGQSHLLLCENQFVIYGGFDGEFGDPDFEKCWYLPFPTHSQKLPNVYTQPATELQKTMKQFFKEAPYSDIAFEVESQVIPAHKWWLTQKSKYFMNMFSSGMLETQASKITITDMNANTFKAFLEFLYSDHAELNYTLALELLQQADKYSVPDLKTACENYLKANITPESYVVIGQVAELVDAVSLRQAVVEYIGKNIKRLKKRKDFDEISDSLLRDSIVKFLGK